MRLAQSIYRRIGEGGLKMKHVLISGVLGCISIWASVGFAYEPGNHGTMSDFAAQNSVLAVPIPGIRTTVLKDIDLKGYTDISHPFPDIQKGEKVDLDPKGANRFIAPPKLPSVQQLVITGAELEDESGFFSGRPLNHFFDPISSFALNYPGYASNYTAPAWAQNSHCAGSSQTTPYNPSGDDASDTNQCFSLQDGVNYFYYALTLPNSDDRDQQFGNLFLTVGHVMHLVQDMAQPQHVRNDAHCDAWQCFLVGKYNPSRYEIVTYGANGEKSADFVGSAGKYGSVSFPSATGKASDFWSTSNSSGLAQYTNKNFFSAGSLGLYGGAGQTYILPTIDENAVSRETVQQVRLDVGDPPNSDIDSAIKAECPDTAPCYVSFVASTGHDYYRGNDLINSKAAATSLFSGDLAKKGDTKTFSLNDATYQAAWPFLIPAAIDYSTGLVNYFFRGRLGVDLDPHIAGNYVVGNLSDYAFSNGTLEVYYDSTDPSTGKLDRYKITGVTAANGADLTHLSLDANCGDTCNNSISITIPPAQTPTPANPGQYMFVFKGTIGTEPGVAGLSYTSKQGPGLMLDWANANAERSTTPTRLYSFDASGNLEDNDFVVGDGSGFLTLQIAEYHGDAITTNGVNVYTNLGIGTLYPIGPCGLNARQVGGVAVNDYGVYVTTIYNCPADGATQQGGTFDHFDFMGNKISSVPDTSFLGYTNPYGNNYSANDTEICSGNKIIKLDPNHDVGGQSQITLPLAAGDMPIDCAVTSNRIYVLTVNLDSTGTPTGPDFILVFDTDGNYLGIIPDVPGETMAATDTDIYLSQQDSRGDTTHTIYHYVRKVVRNPDKTIQSETFTRSPTDIQLTGHTGISQAVVVDMLYVLDGPIQ